MKTEADRMLGQLTHGLWDYSPDRESEVLDRAANIRDTSDAQAFRDWMRAEWPENN